tara:strand:+ start:602 stop:880 length:279 start_codon:yes stop_codon:yes gene_type:complete
MTEPKTRSPRDEYEDSKRGPQARKSKINKDGIQIIVVDDKYLTNPKKYFEDQEIIIMNPERKAKGGRAGYKSGMRVCKLAKRGKGKAYGKNS